jgi:hypothetical protein
VPLWLDHYSPCSTVSQGTCDHGASHYFYYFYGLGFLLSS